MRGDTIESLNGYMMCLAQTDIDIEDGMNGYPEFSVMTNLSCPKCFSEVEIWKKNYV